VSLALVPLGVVTKMLRSPVASEGDTAVISVGETAVTLAAATEPKSTSVVPMSWRSVPVMVTVVPPLDPPTGARRR